MKNISIHFEHSLDSKNGIGIDGKNLLYALNRRRLLNIESSDAKTKLNKDMNEVKVRSRYSHYLYSKAKIGEIAFFQQIPPLPLYRKNWLKATKVFRIHDFFPLTAPQAYSYRARLSFWRRIRSLKYGSIFLCNSEETMNILVAFDSSYIDSAEVVSPLIPSYGYDVLNQGPCGYCTCTTNLPDRFILSISAFSLRKQPEQIIEFWKRNLMPEGIPLILVSSPLSKKSARLFKEKIRALTPSQHSLFSRDFLIKTNQCPHGIRKLYESASGYFSSTKLEGFNMPVHDAVFHGLPTIAHPSSYARKEIVKSGIFAEERNETLLFLKSVNLTVPRRVEDGQILEAIRIFEDNLESCLKRRI